ncbi:hypothetical protein [Umezawaea sp. REN6]|uniref:hypothetical protein n=1 Tax=Umezawaea beigongshangensis TaxID=2780383 RepID=UPI0018F205E5
MTGTRPGAVAFHRAGNVAPVEESWNTTGGGRGGFPVSPLFLLGGAREVVDLRVDARVLVPLAERVVEEQFGALRQLLVGQQRPAAR